MFVVLTQIGKDLEVETPGRMSLLVTCLREAFLTNHIHPQVVYPLPHQPYTSSGSLLWSLDYSVEK